MDDAQLLRQLRLIWQIIDTNPSAERLTELNEKALALIASYSREARIDEVLKMRAVGDKVAAQASPSFEELAAAYDNHILKRAADLTEAGASLEDSHEE